MKLSLVPLVLCACCFAVVGCKLNEKGERVADPDAIKASTEAVGAAGAASGVPFLQLGGLIAAAVGGSVAAYLKGANKGYDQGSQDAGRPLPSASN